MVGGGFLIAIFFTQFLIDIFGMEKANQVEEECVQSSAQPHRGEDAQAHPVQTPQQLLLHPLQIGRVLAWHQIQRQTDGQQQQGGQQPSEDQHAGEFDYLRWEVHTFKYSYLRFFITQVSLFCFVLNRIFIKSD